MPEWDCPFTDCKKGYTTISSLKGHLCKLNAAPDELHPVTDTETWKLVQEKGYLKTFSRPGNLTEAQRKARRQSTNHRNYNRHKDKYVEHARSTRDTGRKALEAAFELQQLYQAKSGKLANSTVLHDLFENPVTINEWIDMETMPPGPRVFPQFVTFFFAPNTWPQVEPFEEYDDDNPAPRLLDCIPGARTYRELCRLTHPDTASQRDSPTDPAIIQRLTASWEIWQPIVSSEEFADLRLWEDGKEDELAGNVVKVAELYWTWMNVANEAKNKLLPTKLTGYRLHLAFTAATAAAAGTPATPPSETNEADREAELLEALSKAKSASPHRRRRRQTSVAATTNPAPNPDPVTPNNGETVSPSGAENDGRYHLRAR